MLEDVKVFISSVRSGLEDERRALPGIIRALGHQPVMFEDFGARVEPSREACLRGVAESDVYLLLLGPHYGYKFPETGQSATHDEWVAAKTSGIERLVFHKANVEHDAEQHEFVSMVGDYSSGSFWAEYTGESDLLTKVAEALRGFETKPSALTFEPLAVVPGLEWKSEWAAGGRGGWGATRENAYVEMHVVPLEPNTLSARRMRDIPEAVVTRMRTFGALAFDAGVEVDANDSAVTVTLPEPVGRTRGAVRGRRLAGVRLSASGQLSTWFELPGDQMGSMLDRIDLTEGLTDQLRLAGALSVLSGERFAVAVGVGGSTTMLSLGTPGSVSRSSVTMGPDGPIRVEPDESVSAAAFDQGAAEVGRALTEGLISRFNELY